MSAAFLPGFAQDKNEAPAVATAPPVAHATGRPELYDRRWDAFAFRVKQFTCSLPPARRAEIARRSRFRNQAYLRRVGEADLDDALSDIASTGVERPPDPDYP